MVGGIVDTAPPAAYVEELAVSAASILGLVSVPSTAFSGNFQTDRFMFRPNGHDECPAGS